MLLWFCPGLASNHNPPTYASRVHEIIGMCHHTHLLWLPLQRVWMSWRHFLVTIYMSEYLHNFLFTDKSCTKRFCKKCVRLENQVDATKMHWWCVCVCVCVC
jgi:hypothetical protein